MTPETIRELDGPALTALAVHLGLMDWERYFHPIALGPGRFVNASTIALFAPHVVFAQAREVFFSLTIRGYHAKVGMRALDDPHQLSAGYAEAESRDMRRFYVIRWGGPADTIQTEAHALLLVACLAVAGEESTHVSPA